MTKELSRLPEYIEAYNSKADKVVRYYLTMKGYQSDENKFFIGYLNEQLAEGLEASVSTSYEECARELLNKIKQYI